MVDAVVSVLLDKLVTFLINEGGQLLGFNDELDEIRKEFEYMQNFLKDVDRVRRKDRTETLKTVINQLRELVYDVEDIITDCQLLSQRRCQGWITPSLNTCFSPITFFKSRYLIGRQLRDVNKRIKQVKKNMKSYLPTVPAHGRIQEVSENIPLTYPILMTEDSIVGLEDESSQIMSWLLAEGDYLKVVGIVGMGGIGKTTLAQKIWKSKITEAKFKPLIFITVSQSFRFKELVKQMLNKIGVADELLHGKGIADLLGTLKNELDGGKYLIVLDDVWELNERQWWYSLASALPQGKGGCVMVTTRNKEVARYMGAADEHIYHAETLSQQNSWSLFCKVAFARNGGISPNAESEKCGKEIVAACGGLPLTIRTVGGMMLAKGNSIIEWQKMSKHLKQEMASGKKLDELVTSRLELSYEELPTNLMPCLLCLAMFPEDDVPSSQLIIEMWIAEGFVWGRRGKPALEMGAEYLNELCNRCLISKDEEEQYGSGIAYYKMHDAVRKMLIKIATEESFFSMTESQQLPVLSKPSRRLVMHESVPQETIENNSFRRLLTLFAYGTDSKVVTPYLEANLKRLRMLRRLHLHFSDEINENVKSAKWVNGMGSLYHLVSIHLQNIHALTTLPDSIGNLPNLQILHIHSCRNLDSLPPSITKLQKLIVFIVYNCPEIESLPNGLGKLSNLERLVCVKSNDPDVINPWISISELKNLKNLRVLGVEISKGEQVGEEEWTTLQMPECLQILGLCFPGVIPPSAAGISRKMDRPLCRPLQDLKELYLDFYPGESTPAWLSPTFLPNLCDLQVSNGRMKKMGEGFFTEGAAWKVETLVLFELEELEEEWETIERKMPFLRFAHVKNCPKLKYSEETFGPGRYGWRTWKKYIRGESSGSSLAT